MHRSRPAAAPLTGAARPRMILWLAVLVVGLSLLAMHQLSSNHTAADPTSTHDTASLTTADSHHHAAGHASVTGAGHAHLLPMAGEEHPGSEQGGCPGCAGHSAMALTCLAALILLAAGLLLRGPSGGREILQRRPTPLTVPNSRNGRRPPPLSLVELSVSRT
ncbi:MAG TPA: hypothetical protein VFR88_04860 [Microlunatus sp.]|nr:hypothetical protein [Microlunatus sp.]